MFGGLEMTTKKKLGGLGKLSQFSGIKPTEPVIDVEPEPKEEAVPIAIASQTPVTHVVVSPNTEKLVSINIKISKAQKDWLGTVASQVRDNNSEPVPPNERVYPQHLIGVAIDLLKAADLDWSQIKNIEDLEEALNL